MRIILNKDKNVLQQLSELHQKITFGNHYSYLPLHEIQKQTKIPTKIALFYSLFVFENYPLDQDLFSSDVYDSALKIDNLEAFEKTNYPLMIIIYPGDTLSIKVAYDADCFTQANIIDLISHIKNCLDWIIAHPYQSLVQVDFLTTEEKEKLAFHYLH